MGNVQVRMVFEILGRPAEHLSESLKMLVNKIVTEKDVKLIDAKYHEPKPIENNLFTTFVEVELELNSILRVFGIIFAYFPAHVEILSPRDLKLGNEELNDISNNLLARLHNYDAIVKKLMFEKEQMMKNNAPKEEPKVEKKKKSKKKN